MYTRKRLNTYTNHFGMLYLRARWYQPQTGRFFSPDPIIPDFQNPQSINRYLYALANPANLIDPTGLYSIAEIKEIFDNAPFYDPDVLRYFERDGSLRDRWGWLHVLRKAENGDRLLVYERECWGCCTDYPEMCAGLEGCLWGPDLPNTPSSAGLFQKNGWDLTIGGVDHMEVALMGYRYNVQKPSHMLPSPYEYEDPIYTHFETKWRIDAAYRYMGLRRDPALMDPIRLASSVVALVIPKIGERLGAKLLEEILGLGLAIEVIEPARRGDMTSSTQEITLFLVQESGKRLHPWLAVGTELIDLGSDAGEIVVSLGYRWVP
jgi:RHS repeat-associated protein